MDNDLVRASVSRHPGRQGHPARRHRLVPQRDGALPQPVGLPPRARGEADADFKERVRAELRARLDEVKAEGLLVPQVVWGYFPVNAEGNDLVVYTDDERNAERSGSRFPRQRKEPYLCIADFFRSADSQVARLRGLPDRDRWRRRLGADRRAVRCATATATTWRRTGCRSR